MSKRRCNGMGADPTQADIPAPLTQGAAAEILAAISTVVETHFHVQKLREPLQGTKVLLQHLERGLLQRPLHLGYLHYEWDTLYINQRTAAQTYQRGLQ